MALLKAYAFRVKQQDEPALLIYSTRRGCQGGTTFRSGWDSILSRKHI